MCCMNKLHASHVAGDVNCPAAWDSLKLHGCLLKPQPCQVLAGLSSQPLTFRHIHTDVHNRRPWCIQHHPGAAARCIKFMSRAHGEEQMLTHVDQCCLQQYNLTRSSWANIWLKAVLTCRANRFPASICRQPTSRGATMSSVKRGLFTNALSKPKITMS